jgi:lysophospholipase L1-like esterase
MKLFLILAFCSIRAFAQEPLPTAVPSPSPTAISAREASYEKQLREFAEMDTHSALPSAPVLFVGSSTIEHWTTLARDFPGLLVLNRGVGGSTVQDLIRYFEPTILKYHPGKIVIYSGDNDIGSGRTPESVDRDMKKLLTQIREAQPDVPVVVISIKPSPKRARFLAQTREANALIQATVQRFAHMAYVSVFEQMLTTDGKPRTALFGHDQLHMNAQGYRLWKQILVDSGYFSELGKP